MSIGPGHASRPVSQLPKSTTESTTDWPQVSMSIPSRLVTDESLAAAEQDTEAAAEQDTDIEKLRREFDYLLSIKDALKRDYRLIQQAKASDIATDIYKEMFVAYQERQVRILGSIVPWVRRAASLIGYLTIFSGLFLFILEADARKETAHNEAWKTLNDVKAGETSSAGRIGALETLTAGCDGKFAQGKPLHGFRQWPVVGGFIPDCVSLQGLDAQKAHLTKIQLPGAVLDNARLQDVGLWEANLAGASLNSAQLWRAGMSKANLSHSEMKNAQMQGAHLPNADLTEANLTGAKLNCSGEPPEDRCADLSGTILVNTQFNKAELKKANLSKANLSEANLSEANLSQANLSQANLMKTNLSEANLTRADLTQADLTWTNLDQAILLKTDLSTATFGSQLLFGKNPPLLCQTRLPKHIEIDINRDCELISQVLEIRLTNNIERAGY